MARRITSGTLAKITKVLDESVFSSACFQVDLPSELELEEELAPEDRKFLFKVTFLDRHAYFFSCDFDPLPFPESGTYNAQFSPGEMFTQNYASFHQFEDCLAAVRSWCLNIHAELKATDVRAKDFERFKAEISAQIDAHINDPDAHFSNKEIDILRDRFSELESKFTKLAEQQEATEQEIQKIRTTIAGLIEAMDTMPKRAFLKSAWPKLHELAVKVVQSPAGQMLLSEAAKKLLGPSS